MDEKCEEHSSVRSLFEANPLAQHSTNGTHTAFHFTRQKIVITFLGKKPYFQLNGHSIQSEHKMINSFATGWAVLGGRGSFVLKDHFILQTESAIVVYELKMIKKALNEGATSIAQLRSCLGIRSRGREPPTRQPCHSDKVRRSHENRL